MSYAYVQKTRLGLIKATRVAKFSFQKHSGNIALYKATEAVYTNMAHGAVSNTNQIKWME